MKNFITTLFLILAPLSLYAQPACMQYSDAIAYLENQYNEYVVAQGLTSDGLFFQLHANLESGTWTATVTATNGITCLASAGQNLELVDTPQGDDI